MILPWKDTEHSPSVGKYDGRTSAESGDGYIPRYLDYELDELEGPLALAIDGAKGVGKTATAVRRTCRHIHLDNSYARQQLEANNFRELSSAESILIDEWQRMPEVWDRVRRLVDDRHNIRFLLTGSATPYLNTNIHSGAGRILSLRMRPLSLAERPGVQPTVWLKDLFEGRADNIGGETDMTLAGYSEHICSTGLPGIMNLPPRMRRQAISSYIQNVVDRDIPEQGVLVRKPESLRSWWAAYAAASSTMTSYTKILDAATPGDTYKISKDTAMSYRDILMKLWLLEPVPAWFPSMAPLKKLTSTPKHQIFDPGIAAALLNTTSEHLLSGVPGAFELFGQLFESFATLNVRVAAQVAEAKVFHMRDYNGRHEIDLLVERYDGSVIACEVKLKAVVGDGDVEHLHWLEQKLGSRLKEKIIITAGNHAFRRSDGVIVVPLALLG